MLCFMRKKGKEDSLREVSTLDPSGEGNGERSKTIIFVSENVGRCARAYAVLRPKTPEPTIRTVFGAIFESEDEGTMQ